MGASTTKKGETKARPRKPMKLLTKSYASVDEMVRDNGDAEFAAEFAKHQADRQLVNCLTVMRGINEVSQEELAARMGCTQSKVSKMEASADAEINFGDMISYAVALRQGIHISFSPTRKNGADHIRFHFECIKHELNHLVRIAGDDKAIGDGVERFAIEQVQSMVKLVEGVLGKLPHRIDQADRSVSVEAEGDRGERLPVDLPPRSRRVSKKRASMA